MVKMNMLSIGLLMMAAACGSSGNDEPNKPNPTPGEDNKVTDVATVKSNLSVGLSTDRACYAPGERVEFTASELPGRAKIRYRHGSSIVKEEPMTSLKWYWTPSNTDFKGYMVEIWAPGDKDNEEVILGTIAVDVSSDWTKYPRYGFVATFDDSKLADGVIENEMAFLNRCHINGVQFQDWHYKHHWPMPGTRDNVLESYTDIANRTLSAEAVKKYISVQHSLGMKSIFYNLCFGVLDDAKADGVKDEWYLFKNPNRGDKDMHTLPSNWKSNIYLVDPANEEWQAYLVERNDEVYANFDFDGYQIDQLGNRGDLYDYNGNNVNLPKGYASFIGAMKQKHPAKRLIMNAVSSYGASQIAGSGKVDFCYNELWNDEANFNDLHTVIKANDSYSGNSLRTVFAAYMNYDKADKTTGEFNTPGILMADAVMMALGGSHLELGDHMLSREYFPASPLSMSEELRDAIVHYYDFMTAYQNLLRDTSTETEFKAEMKCTDASKRVNINAWPPKENGLTTYAKNVDGKKVVHLLNFRNIDNLSWRDLNGERPAPRLTLNTPLELTHSGKVTRIWTASPDYHGGAVVELPFTQSGDKLTFTLPSLKYWSMIVVE